jgi:hypothetical protein
MQFLKGRSLDSTFLGDIHLTSTTPKLQGTGTSIRPNMHSLSLSVMKTVTGKYARVLRVPIPNNLKNNNHDDDDDE